MKAITYLTCKKSRQLRRIVWLQSQAVSGLRKEAGRNAIIRYYSALVKERHRNDCLMMVLLQDPAVVRTRGLAFDELKPDHLLACSLQWKPATKTYMYNGNIMEFIIICLARERNRGN